MNRTLVRAGLAFALLPITLAAQTYTPKTIVFTGAPYPSADLLKASGLTPGKPITKAGIDEALRVINDTGLFASERYSVDDRALTFALVPQDPAAMLPAVYTNFVVLDLAEITPLVHARVPLFTGKVPNNGNLVQSVQDALVAILADKGIKARVDNILGDGAHSQDFSIADPPVQIGAVHVEGVSASARAKVAELCSVYAAELYEPASDASLRKRLTDDYQDLGFLDIAIDPSTRSAPKIEPTRISVDLSTTAHEGGQYHLTKFEFPVSAIVSPADFARAAQIKPGEVASRIEVLSTTGRIGSEFGGKGFFDADVKIAEHKDTAAHTIGYTYTATPGERYTVKETITASFNPQQQKEFDKDWKLKPGTPYDHTLADAFFTRNGGVFQGYTIKSGLRTNRADHTVTLTYTVTKRP